MWGGRSPAVRGSDAKNEGAQTTRGELPGYPVGIAAGPAGSRIPIYTGAGPDVVCARIISEAVIAIHHWVRVSQGMAPARVPRFTALADPR